MRGIVRPADRRPGVNYGFGLALSLYKILQDYTVRYTLVVGVSPGPLDTLRHPVRHRLVEVRRD